jgi:hypothetical protein
MRRLLLVLAVALVMAAMLMASAPNAFAEGNGRGWGANDCWRIYYPWITGPGCGYHLGQ